MILETVRIAELRAPERNVRRHPQKQIDEMVRSVEMFGQIRPMVIDEGGTVLVGNCLREALMKMGAEEAQAYRVTGLSESEKLKLMMADNKVFQLGMDDMVNIEGIMAELEDFDIPGFDEDTLDALYGDMDIAVETAMSYGSYDDSVRERAEAVAERREAAIAPPPVPTRAEETNAPTAAPQEPTAARPTEERAESRRYVTCPHCGERIWV